MTKTLAITTFALVAVIMGMSAIAPYIIPEAEAHRSQTQLPEQACRALDNADVRNNPAVRHLLEEHCDESRKK